VPADSTQTAVLSLRRLQHSFQMTRCTHQLRRVLWLLATVVLVGWVVYSGYERQYKSQPHTQPSAAGRADGLRHVPPSAAALALAAQSAASVIATDAGAARHPADLVATRTAAVERGRAKAEGTEGPTASRPERDPHELPPCRGDEGGHWESQSTDPSIFQKYEQRFFLDPDGSATGRKCVHRQWSIQAARTFLAHKRVNFVGDSVLRTGVHAL
jgi:hypothetical protein